MRAFIVLAVVAAANAGLLPNPLGYAYGVGQSTGQIVSTNAYGNAINPGNTVSYGGSGSLASGGLLGNGDSYGTGGSLVSGGLLGHGGSGLSGGLLGHGGSVVSGGILGNGISYGTGGSYNAGQVGGSTVIGLSALDSVPQTVEYSKQFFHFAAPEEDHHASHIQNQLSNVLKKNLQVVFIKAPENNAATNAAVQLAKQAIEQRTAIYVLSKENDASQVIGQIKQIQENVQTSPEVRIIKYRTPHDIAVAKQSIQAQYENTGGSSQTFDGGVAPVLNYASNVGYGNGGVHLVGGVGGGIAGSSLISSGGNGIISGNGNAGINYLPASPLK